MPEVSKKPPAFWILFICYYPFVAIGTIGLYLSGRLTGTPQQIDGNPSFFPTALLFGALATFVIAGATYLWKVINPTKEWIDAPPRPVPPEVRAKEIAKLNEELTDLFDVEKRLREAPKGPVDHERWRREELRQEEIRQLQEEFEALKQKTIRD